MLSPARTTLIACALAWAATPVAAQVKLDCIPKEACSVATNAESVKIRVHVNSAGAPPPLVHFSAAQGTVITPVRPVQGVAETTWRGTTSKSAPVVVTAWVESAGVTDPLHISVLAPGGPPTGYGLELFDGDDQVWYTGRMLPDSLTVRVTNVGERDCGGVSVVFKQFGDGLVAPDTVRPRFENEKCRASARWRLAGNVGKQDMMVRIAGESAPPKKFTATARQLPRLAFAIVGTALTDHYERLVNKPDTTTVAVETVDPVTGAKTVRTSRVVTQNPELEEVKENFDGEVAFGIDFPLRPRWTRFRAFAGVSAADPTEIFYLGFSPLQSFGKGLPMEAVGIDAYMGIRGTTRKVGTDRDCGTERYCEDTGLRFDGLFLAAVVDGSQLLSNILKAFVPGS